MNSIKTVYRLQQFSLCPDSLLLNPLPISLDHQRRQTLLFSSGPLSKGIQSKATLGTYVEEKSRRPHPGVEEGRWEKEIREKCGDAYENIWANTFLYSTKREIFYCSRVFLCRKYTSKQEVEKSRYTSSRRLIQLSQCVRLRCG